MIISISLKKKGKNIKVDDSNHKQTFKHKKDIQAQGLSEVTVHCFPLKKDKSHCKEINILKGIPINENANSVDFSAISVELQIPRLEIHSNK